MVLLENKVIIVTGATSGIGAAAAIEAARQGAKVVAASRRADRGEEVVARIRAEGGEALFVRTDVTKDDEIEALVASALRAYGRLDGAFNNAGIPGPVGTLEQISADEYRALLGANLDSIFVSMKHEIRAMKETGGGSIVNCSSILGTVGGPSFSPYVTSKHGILGLTKAAAIDYAASGIRVNAVLPGPVSTEIWDHVKNSDPIFQAFIAGTVMGRAASSEEVARPVVFLLSDWASYITGTSLLVDGGYTIR
ncbi:SDR family oxidoreductase [Sorangium sp. So ce131]|uniref:SDR family oxidoreductase n=1 Tax=Sorangium sp. So ce131 TaxID=3133282 RepID=UPI003F5F593C